MAVIGSEYLKLLNGQELVIAVRAALNYTQTELADRLGYGQGGQNKISEMEHGKRQVSGPIRKSLFNLIESEE